MSTLFIATKTPKSGLQIETVLKLAIRDDAIILAQDAVFSVKMNPNDLDSASKRGVVIFAVRPDMEARSIIAPSYVRPVDYAGFVDLILQYARIFS
jgi:tRNA 2-thiouridine synthesizing protein B